MSSAMQKLETLFAAAAMAEEGLPETALAMLREPAPRPAPPPQTTSPGETPHRPPLRPAATGRP